MLTSPVYIACLNLQGRRALVVGGGPVAVEKVEGLLTCDAAVAVVAPEVAPELAALAEEGRIAWTERGYEPSDLGGCFLVVAATSDESLNRRVYEDAEARSMLVNVVDVPELCNFILPAILRRGPLAVGISTSGASPALAKRLKRDVATIVSAEYAELATLLDEVREWAKETLPTYRDRKEFFERIVDGDPDPIELLARGEIDAVRSRIGAARTRAEERFRS